VLETERVGDCAVWTIARPQAKNALNLETIDQLLLAVEGAAKDKTLRAVVLTGAGDAFVSGGDLRELRDATTEKDAGHFADVGAELCGKLGALPVPVIAALPGAALGGGAELAVACDLRVADARAKISFKQVRMGVTTAWGSIGRLVALVGRGGAARLLLTAHELNSLEAKAIGLVDEVVADGSCREVALAWALDVAQGSPTAVAEMKALLRLELDILGAEERRRFVATWTGPDHSEAMQAYFARRAPRWSSRQ
jgi:enoyl-CoA hydratase